MSEDGPSGAAAVQRLRTAIDAGQTGEKVPVADPAAAPLGTDDEAAGTPVSAARAQLAHRNERASAPRSRPQDSAGSGRLAVIAVAAAIAALLGWVWLA